MSNDPQKRCISNKWKQMYLSFIRKNALENQGYLLTALKYFEKLQNIIVNIINHKKKSGS